MTLNIILGVQYNQLYVYKSQMTFRSMKRIAFEVQFETNLKENVRRKYHRISEIVLTVKKIK